KSCLFPSFEYHSCSDRSYDSSSPDAYRHVCENAAVLGGLVTRLLGCELHPGIDVKCVDLPQVVLVAYLERNRIGSFTGSSVNIYRNAKWQWRILFQVADVLRGWQV